MSTDDEMTPLEMLERLNARKSGRWAVGYVPGIYADSDNDWWCGTQDPYEGAISDFATGPTPEAAIRAAWDAVQGEEVAS